MCMSSGVQFSLLYWQRKQPHTRPSGPAARAHTGQHSDRATGRASRNLPAVPSPWLALTQTLPLNPSDYVSGSDGDVTAPKPTPIPNPLSLTHPTPPSGGGVTAPYRSFRPTGTSNVRCARIFGPHFHQNYIVHPHQRTLICTKRPRDATCPSAPNLRHYSAPRPPGSPSVECCILGSLLGWVARALVSTETLPNGRIVSQICNTPRENLARLCFSSRPQSCSTR
eukprot:COSAG02_NODE_281_length_25776_cov_37.797998_21_plen_225_part_00